MKSPWIVIPLASIFMLITSNCVVSFAQDRDSRDRPYDRHGDHARRGDEHRHFDDQDRDILRDWYRDHSDLFEPQAHEQRWNNEEIESHLESGRVFDDNLRRWAHPIPEELEYRLAPLPHDWRYMMIGYNICIVDRDWTIRDIYHFDQFSDHDRQVIQDWNRDHPDALRGILGSFGIRIDNGDLDRRLQLGEVVDPDLRNRARPAPEDLTSRLSVPPRDWRYVIIGDRLFLVDRGWRVHESFHFQH